MKTPAELNQLKSTIIHLLEIGWTPSSIAQEFNISHQTVEHLARCSAANDALEVECPDCGVTNDLVRRTCGRCGGKLSHDS